MKKKGFTLIELLVVIAIIAILAAILFPVFAQAREQARATACLSNVKQLGLGLLMYTQDYDQRFPTWNWGFFCNGGNNGAPRDSSAFWTMAIYPYVKSVGLYQDQDDIMHWNDTWAGCSDDGGRNDIFSSAYNIHNYVSYGLAEDLDPPSPSNRMAGIITPANWAMLMDCASQLADIWVWQLPNAGNANLLTARAAFANNTSQNVMWNCCQTAAQYTATYGSPFLDSQTRHHGGENVTFVDGHSKYMTWSQMTWANLTDSSWQ